MQWRRLHCSTRQGNDVNKGAVKREKMVYCMSTYIVNEYKVKRRLSKALEEVFR